MSEEDYKIAYENVMIANKMLEQENKQLKEEYKKVSDELLQYEIQNSKLQKELVELRVNTGRSVILGDKENE